MCYKQGMYKKGFVPGDIVYWWFDRDDGPREINIAKVISIKMAKYKYRLCFSGDRPCMAEAILRDEKQRNPIFLIGEKDKYPGWMGEEDLFKFDKAAKVLYGTKEALDSASRLAGKRKVNDL